MVALRAAEISVLHGAVTARTSSSLWMGVERAFRGFPDRDSPAEKIPPSEEDDPENKTHPTIPVVPPPRTEWIPHLNGLLGTEVY